MGKNKYGLVRMSISRGYALGYGWNHGALCWLPDWTLRLIVRLWNPINCAMYGHDDTLKDIPGHEDGVPCINCDRIIEGVDADG